MTSRSKKISAFPNDYGTEGMTLRDYFAAKAMQAQITLIKGDESQNLICTIPVIAYGFADAMLKARES